MQGCGFDCLACHNPQTICTRATPNSRWMTTDEVLVDIAAAAPFLSGVTVSGGEATLQWEWVHELFGRLRTEATTSRLTRLVDTNGDAEPFVWSRLAPVMNGAMVDLKALDPEVHRFLTGRSNERVLASLRQLDAAGQLTEVRPPARARDQRLRRSTAPHRGLHRDAQVGSAGGRERFPQRGHAGHRPAVPRCDDRRPRPGGRCARRRRAARRADQDGRLPVGYR